MLSEIIADGVLRPLLVVILTTSQSESDIGAIYNLRRSSYIVKPVDFEQFHRVIRTLCDYWFTVIKRPNDKNARDKYK